MLGTVIGPMAAAIVAASLPTQEQSAGFISGNDLYRYCTAREGQATYYQNDASCTAYIMGAHDALATAGGAVTYIAELDRPLRLVCTPPGVEAGQIRDVVVLWLRDKPADRSMPASLVVMSALAEAFPCRSA